MTILIPDPPFPHQSHPGDIQPGEYTVNEFVQLLRDHADEPDTIRFLADMLEE